MSAENQKPQDSSSTSGSSEGASSGPQMSSDRHQFPSFDSGGSSVSSRISAGKGSEIQSTVGSGDVSASYTTSGGTRGPDGSGSRISVSNSGRNGASVRVEGGSSSSERRDTSSGGESSSSSGPELYTKDGEFKSTGDPQADLDRWKKGVEARIQASQDHYAGRTKDQTTAVSGNLAKEKVFSDGSRQEVTLDDKGLATSHIDMGKRGKFTINEQSDGSFKVQLPGGEERSIPRPAEGGVRTTTLPNGVTGIFEFRDDGTCAFATHYATLSATGGTRYDNGVESTIEQTIVDPKSWLDSPSKSGDGIQRTKVGDMDVATKRDGDMTYIETDTPSGMRVRVARDSRRPGQEVVYFPNGTRVHVGAEKKKFNDGREETDKATREEAAELAAFLRDDEEEATSKDGELSVLWLDADKYLGKNKYRDWTFRKILEKRMANGQPVCLRTDKSTRNVEQSLNELVKKGYLSQKDLQNIMVLGEKGTVSTRYDANGERQHDVPEEYSLPDEFKSRVAELLKHPDYGGGAFTLDITRETNLPIKPRKEVEREMTFTQKKLELRRIRKAIEEMMEEMGLDTGHEVSGGFLGGSGVQILCKEAGKNLEDRKYLEFQAELRKKKEEEMNPMYY